MNQHIVLSGIALLSSIFLLTQVPERILPAIAALASGLELLIAFGIIHLGVRGISIQLVLALGLLVPAALTYFKVSTKTAVTAATAATLIGLFQVLGNLHGL